MNFTELQTQLSQAIAGKSGSAVSSPFKTNVHQTVKLKVLQNSDFCQKVDLENGVHKKSDSIRQSATKKIISAFPGQSPGCIPRANGRSSEPTSPYPGRPPGKPPIRRRDLSGKQFLQPCESDPVRFPGLPPGGCPPRKIPTLKISCPATSSTRVGNLKSKLGYAMKAGQQQKTKPNLPPLPSYPTPPDGLSFRRLQWQSIPDDRTIGTIWESLMTGDCGVGTDVISLQTKPNSLASSTQSSTAQCSVDQQSIKTAPLAARLELSYEKMNALFAENLEAKRKELGKGISTNLSTNQDSKQLCPKFVTVLDSKRRQNLEICLKGLGLLEKVDPLIRTVVHLTPLLETKTEIPTLTPESLQIVLGLYPTPEEGKILRMKIDENPQCKFAKAENFLYELIKIPYFEVRAECVLIHIAYDPLKKVERLNNCLERILKSLQPGGALKTILALILNAGNYINHVSKKGLVRGIALSSLSQLRSFKSTDGSTTLMRFVAEIIECQNKHLWIELRESIGSCQASLDSNVTDLLTLFKQLESKLEKIKKGVAVMEKLKDDKLFVVLFTDFSNKAQIRLDGIKSIFKSVEQKFSLLSQLFGEKGKGSGETILARLAAFWKDLSDAHQENLYKIRKQKEQLLRTSNRLGNQTARLSRSANNGETTRLSQPPLSARPVLSQPAPASPDILQCGTLPNRRSVGSLSSSLSASLTTTDTISEQASQDLTSFVESVVRNDTDKAAGLTRDDRAAKSLGPPSHNFKTKARLGDLQNFQRNSASSVVPRLPQSAVQSTTASPPIPLALSGSAKSLSQSQSVNLSQTPVLPGPRATSSSKLTLNKQGCLLEKTSLAIESTFPDRHQNGVCSRATIASQGLLTNRQQIGSKHDTSSTIAYTKQPIEHDNLKETGSLQHLPAVAVTTPPKVPKNSFKTPTSDSRVPRLDMRKVSHNDSPELSYGQLLCVSSRQTEKRSVQATTSYWNVLQESNTSGLTSQSNTSFGDSWERISEINSRPSPTKSNFQAVASLKQSQAASLLHEKRSFINNLGTSHTEIPRELAKIPVCPIADLFSRQKLSDRNCNEVSENCNAFDKNCIGDCNKRSTVELKHTPSAFYQYAVPVTSTMEQGMNGSIACSRLSLTERGYPKASPYNAKPQRMDCFANSHRTSRPSGSAMLQDTKCLSDEDSRRLLNSSIEHLNSSKFDCFMKKKSSSKECTVEVAPTECLNRAQKTISSSSTASKKSKHSKNPVKRIKAGLLHYL